MIVTALRGRGTVSAARAPVALPSASSASAAKARRAFKGIGFLRGRRGDGMCSSLLHQRHRHIRQADRIGGHGAEQQMGERGLAVSADDDLVEVALLGVARDRGGGMVMMSAHTTTYDNQETIADGEGQERIGNRHRLREAWCVYCTRRSLHE